MLFSRISVATVVPWVAAMPERVSPGLTRYVRVAAGGVDGFAVGLAVGFAVGLAVGFGAVVVVGFVDARADGSADVTGPEGRAVVPAEPDAAGRGDDDAPATAAVLPPENLTTSTRTKASPMSPASAA